MHSILAFRTTMASAAVLLGFFVFVHSSRTAAPGGMRQTLENVQTDRILQIEEPSK